MKILAGAPVAAASARSGFVLVWAMVLAFVMVSSSLVFSLLAGTTDAISDREEAETRGRYLALGALELAAADLEAALERNAPVPDAGSVRVGDRQVDYTLELLSGPDWETTDSGLDAIRSVYGLETTVELDGSVERARQLLAVELVPLFQFALFYEEDMHFLYPAPMVVGGPVHCNSDVYLYAHQGLRFDTNHFTVAGGVYNRMKHGEWATAYPWGDPIEVDVRKWVADPYDPFELEEYFQILPKVELDALGVPSTSGFDSDFAGYDVDGDGFFDGAGDWLPFAPGVLALGAPPDFYAGGGDGHTLRTGAHAVQSVRSPSPEDFELLVEVGPGEGSWAVDEDTGAYVEVGAGNGTHDYSEYYTQAELKLVSYPDGTWKALDGDGVDVTAAVAPAVSVDSIYDAREARAAKKSVPVLSVDMDALKDTGLFPKNGLLYAGAWRESTETDVRGFQFHDAAALADDLSIVSPDSVYLQGDFNVDGSRRAAVMADAVNLLSNAWTNSKSPGLLPAASETKYVVSVLAGDVEATSSSFNGGPHNLVRFHEDWEGVTNTIQGSLVCTGHSRRATGRFRVYDDFYVAPNRVWVFDEALSDPNGLPPFSPRYVDVQNLILW